MTLLRISLFGRLQIESDERRLGTGLDGRKVQELLSYLLLYKKQIHARENLSEVLWGNSNGAQSRKYLRQALWQLQAALKFDDDAIDELLIADAEWVGVREESCIWTDAGQFQQAYDGVQGKQGNELEGEAVRAIVKAVELYKGGLLLGWYQDWCIFEREKFQNMYLSMLNKLMMYYEAHEEFELGLAYGHKILQYDRAHERTHWQMMRLHYLSGDRTGALRQYDRCVAALNEELGVDPAKWTSSLYEQIKADQVTELLASVHSIRHSRTVNEPVPLSALAGIDRLQALLAECNEELQRYMQTAGMLSRD